MEIKGTFTERGSNQTVEVLETDFECYRGTETGTIFYMHNGSTLEVVESFNEVDDVFDPKTEEFLKWRAEHGKDN